jgi:hypothetical protein
VSSSSSRPILAVVLLVAAAVAAALVAALMVLREGADRPAAAPARASVAPPAAGPAVSVEASVLARWDARRSRAYARGDARALRALYIRGSPAAGRDVAVLRSYLARGLRVRGLRMQVLALEVREHRPARIRMRVTDRAVGARAVGVGWSRPLPADRPTSREVTLVRADRSWRVARVSGAAPR